MAKILNSTLINGVVSKMVELPENFIINGSVYDKYTLSPNPYDFCPIYSGAQEMFLSKAAFINVAWPSKPVLNGVLMDSVNPDITYIVTQGLLGGNPTIRRITKTPNGTVDQLLVTLSSNSNDECDFISQDNNRVYFYINRNSANYTSYIGYFNKFDGSMSSINLNGNTPRFLKETEIFIYLITETGSSLNMFKYNKTNNTLTTLYSEAQNFYYNDFVASEIDSNGVFYVVKDGKDLGMIDHYIAVKKYVLDTVKDTVTASQVTLDQSLYPNGKILINTGASLYVSHWLLKYNDSVTGKKYMTHVIHNRGKVNIGLNQLDSAMYTYEMIDNDNWKMVSYTSFSPTMYKAFLPVLNNQIFMLAHEASTHVYTWDSASTSYKKTASFDGTMTAIGMDTNNNMYVQYGDTSIEMMSNVMPTTVYADFELDTYNYQGADINTNIIAYVKNYMGQYLATSLTLTLYGNAKFTDSGLKTKTITTSNLNSINIPVTVYDTGLLRVTTKIV